MIRILHSVSNMDRAGIETMLMNYYRHIDRNRVQFDFLCNKTKPGDYDEEIVKLGGKIFHTPGLNPFIYRNYLKYMHSLFKEHPEYKIVHAHNGALVVYPLFAAKKEKIPHRISHVHSASFTIDYKWPLKMVCRPLIPFCANYEWGCGIAASKFYYGEKQFEQGKTRVINNAIEIESFLFNAQIRERLRKQYDLNGKVVIGHAGRFMLQKNHMFLIDIFAQIVKKESKAVLVLLGEGELFKEVQAKVNSLGLKDSVLFQGNVNNVNEWYQAMDVFVLPSIWEGLPVVGIEAQTADLPCVFSDDVTKEVDLIPTNKFLSRKLSVDQWAEEILQSAKKKIRVCRKKEIQDAGYDINIEAEKLVQLYEDMVACRTVV